MATSVEEEGNGGDHSARPGLKGPSYRLHTIFIFEAILWGQSARPRCEERPERFARTRFGDHDEGNPIGRFERR